MGLLIYNVFDVLALCVIQPHVGRFAPNMGLLIYNVFDVAV